MAEKSTSLVFRLKVWEGKGLEKYEYPKPPWMPQLEIPKERLKKIPPEAPAVRKWSYARGPASKPMLQALATRAA